MGLYSGCQLGYIFGGGGGRIIERGLVDGSILTGFCCI